MQLIERGGRRTGEVEGLESEQQDEHRLQKELERASGKDDYRNECKKLVWEVKEIRLVGVSHVLLEEEELGQSRVLEHQTGSATEFRQRVKWRLESTKAFVGQEWSARLARARLRQSGPIDTEFTAGDVIMHRKTEGPRWRAHRLRDFKSHDVGRSCLRAYSRSVQSRGTATGFRGHVRATTGAQWSGSRRSRPRIGAATRASGKCSSSTFCNHANNAVSSWGRNWSCQNHGHRG